MNETTELIMRQLNSKKVHAETHEVGGGDEIDVTKLKNIEDYVTINGDFAGTWNGVEMTSVEPGLSSAFNALKADVVQRAVNVKYPPTGYTAAVGDGITDDTAAIQALLTVGYKNIYIPDGTYLITSPLLIKGSQNVYGLGVASQLNAGGTFNAMFQNYKNGVDTTIITQCSIKNLYLYANGHTVQHGIDYSQVSYSTIDNVECNGFADTGVLCSITTMNASYNLINNCILKNNQDGIRVYKNANSTRIIALTATANTRNGVRIDGLGTNAVQSCEIIGGSIESSGQSGVYLDGRACSIIGVHFEGNSLSYAGYGVETVSGAFYNNVLFGCYFYRNGNDTSNLNHIEGILGKYIVIPKVLTSKSHP